MNIVHELYDDTDHPILFTLLFVGTVAISTYVVYLIVQDWLATLFAVLITLLMFGLIYHAALDEQPGDYRSLAYWLIDFRPPSISAIGLALAVLVVSTILRISLLFVKAFLFPTTESAGHAAVESGPPEGRAILLLILAVVFVGPLIEEVVYRGVLQRFLSNITGASVAILIAAGTFAIAHVPTYGGFGTPLMNLALPMAMIFTDAILWGWLYYRTGNVLTPWLAHAGSNGIAILVWLF